METIKSLVSLPVNESTVDEIVTVLQNCSSKGLIRYSQFEVNEILYLVAQSVDNLDGKVYSSSSKFINIICQIIDDHIEYENDKNAVSTSYSSHISYSRALFVMDILVSSSQSIEKFRMNLKTKELGNIMNLMSNQILSEKEFNTQELAFGIICKVCLALYKKHDKRIDIVIENMPDIVKKKLTSQNTIINVLKSPRTFLNEINTYNPHISSYSIQSVSISNPEDNKITFSSDWVDVCFSSLQVQTNEVINMKSIPSANSNHPSPLVLWYKDIRIPHIDMSEQIFEFSIEGTEEFDGKYQIKFTNVEELSKSEKQLCNLLGVNAETIQAPRYGTVSTKMIQNDNSMKPKKLDVNNKTKNYVEDTNTDLKSITSNVSANKTSIVKNNIINSTVQNSSKQVYKKSSKLDIIPVVKPIEIKNQDTKSLQLDNIDELLKQSNKRLSNRQIQYKKITPNKSDIIERLSDNYNDFENENETEEAEDNYDDILNEYGSIESDYDRSVSNKRKPNLKSKNKSKENLTVKNASKRGRVSKITEDEIIDQISDDDVDDSDNSFSILLADLKALNEKRSIKMRNKRLKAASELANTHINTYQEELSDYVVLKSNVDKISDQVKSTISHFVELTKTIDEYRDNLNKHLEKSVTVYDSLSKNITRIKNEERNEYIKLKSSIQEYKRMKVDELQTRFSRGSSKRS